MPQKTDLNVSPYFDDFDESDNFARTLFRPGFAVQAREVTQLQTILQKQIERHGSHTFQDGSIVLGCELNYDNNIKTIQLETAFSGEDITSSDFANGIVTGGTSNVTAEVKAWDSTNRQLQLFNRTGIFSIPETITGQTSGAAWTTASYNTLNNTSSDFDQNFTLETQADGILDFTEGNPFGEFGQGS